MKRRLWISLALLLIIPGLLLTVSCAKKAVQSESEVIQPEEKDNSEAEEAARQVEIDRQTEIDRQAEIDRQEEIERDRKLEEERLQAQSLRAEEANREMMVARNMFINEDIHFDFDSAIILFSAQDLLKEKARWLEENSDVTIIIEGHCDERGTSAYNLALGDRRAESVKTFLIDLGIASSRLTTISYGEERPVDDASTEEAWAKNRRAHLIIE